MTVSDHDRSVLADSYDIIGIGMLADQARRERHGTTTTFVRVADVPVEPGAPIVCPGGAGELRIVGTPASLAAAIDRVRDVIAAAGGVPVSAFSLADLEQLAAREGLTLRALLE